MAASSSGINLALWMSTDPLRQPMCPPGPRPPAELGQVPQGSPTKGLQCHRRRPSNSISQSNNTKMHTSAIRMLLWIISTTITTTKAMIERA
jgi:hypothetical protein